MKLPLYNYGLHIYDYNAHQLDAEQLNAAFKELSTTLANAITWGEFDSDPDGPQAKIDFRRILAKYKI